MSFVRKFILLSIPLLCFTNNMAAQYPIHNWVKYQGNENSDGTLDVAIDNSGNVYATGYFSGSVNFNNGGSSAILNETDGATDIFIQKRSADGTLLWAKKIGGEGYDYAYDIGVASDGSFYITGEFEGTADFDPDAGVKSYTSYDEGDPFVAKYDKDGKFLWLSHIKSSGKDYASRLVVDKAENVIVSGILNGNADFDPGPNTFLLSYTTPSAFLYKLSSEGSFINAGLLNTSSASVINDLAVDKLNNVYATGYFAYTVDFDISGNSKSVTTDGSPDIFILKLNTSLGYTWVKTMGATQSWEYGQSVVTDTALNVFVTGHFLGTIDLDPSSSSTKNFTSNGSNDSYIVKLDKNGNYIEGYSFGNKGTEQGWQLKTDNENNIYMLGIHQHRAVDYDPVPNKSMLYWYHGGTDLFIVKYNADLDIIWIKTWGSTKNENHCRFDVGRDQSIAIGGSIQTYTRLNIEDTFDIYNSSGNNDWYVIKWNQCKSAPKINDTIAGYTTFCYGENAEFSIPQIVNAIDYNWSVPAGWTIESTGKKIKVKTGNNSGNINLTASNACGTSNKVVKPVNIQNLLTGTIVETSGITALQSGVQYQWLNCDSNYRRILGATFRTFKPTKNGNYAVMLIRQNCIDTSSCANYNSATMNFAKANNPTTKVFPNPASGNLMISAPIHNPISKIQVFSVSGKLLACYENILSSDYMLKLPNTVESVLRIRIILKDNENVNRIIIVNND